ncbi:MAG: hypothetical protein ACFE89_04780 [Candidatus Hodarchaeota archaeon]
MPGSKHPPAIEDSAQVLVIRASELSNKLAKLPKTELMLLKRIYETPNDEQAQKVINKAFLTEYSIHELRVALAALDGVHELPLSECPIGYANAKPWKPQKNTSPLPPQRIKSPSSEAPPLPSAKATMEISTILTSMAMDDFQWLLKNFGTPRDLRSRLIIIKHRLYQYRWEDVAATLAALQRTLPSDESE